MLQKNDFILAPRYFNKRFNNLYKYKNELNQLNNIFYYNNNEINIDNITNLWRYINNTFYLEINNKLIHYNNLYFDIDKNNTDKINYLGFLNKFQYDILHQITHNSYQVYLMVNIQINPLNLSTQYLRTSLYKLVNNYPSIITINIIKKYWLLSEFTDIDEYEINKIFANSFIMKISKG